MILSSLQVNITEITVKSTLLTIRSKIKGNLKFSFTKDVNYELEMSNKIQVLLECC